MAFSSSRPRYSEGGDGPSSPIRDGWTGREIQRSDEAETTFKGGSRPRFGVINRSQSSGGRSAGTESWMDFLRAGPLGSQDSPTETTETQPSNVDGSGTIGRKRAISGTSGTRSTTEVVTTPGSASWLPRRTVSARVPTERRHTRQTVPRLLSEGQMGQQHNIIDLSSPPRARMQRTLDVTTDWSAQQIILPRWQPDEEVNGCIICSRKFSFWNRKHHCRKCGRVVCSDCSPHRVTIPRQYIVRPPRLISDPDGSDDSAPTGLTPPAAALTSGDMQDPMVAPVERASLWGTVIPLGLNNNNSNRNEVLHSFSADDPPTTQPTGTALDGALDPLQPSLGGGEEVRICNPCVPDPNYGPPPQAQRYAASQAIHQGSHLSQLPPNSLGPTLGVRQSTYQTPVSAQDQFMGLGPTGVLPAREPEQEDRLGLFAESLRERGTYRGPSEQQPPSQYPPPYQPDGHNGRPPQYRGPSSFYQTYTHSSRHSSRHSTINFSHPGGSPASRVTSEPTFPLGTAIPATYGGLRVQRRAQHNHTASLGTTRYHSLFDVDALPSAALPPIAQSFIPPAAPPIIAPPRPVYREDDFCPICGGLLPASVPVRNGPANTPPMDRTPAQITVLREAHVEACIASHLSTSSPTTARDSIVTPSQSSTSNPSAAHATSLPRTATALPPRNPKRSSRMLSYVATEKDLYPPTPSSPLASSHETAPEDATARGRAECVICFEEFEVGVEMGRLECFCRFHRRCILGWFAARGARSGECPVHQTNL